MRLPGNIFFLLLCALNQLVAQDPFELQFFEEPESIEWVRHFKGRMDGYNELAITLVLRGEECRGDLTYLRSNERFELRGILKDEILFLQEIDAAGRVSGMLQGKLSEGKFEGAWANYDQTIGGRILLEETQERQPAPTHCAGDKWIYHYSEARKRAELTLQKEEGNRIIGILFVRAEKAVYQLEGFVDNKEKLEVKLFDKDRKEAGWIRGNIRSHLALNLLLEAAEDKKQKYKFSFDSQLMLGCVEYADYFTAYSLTFPKSRHAAFNTWQEKQLSGWMDACRKRTRQQGRKEELATPDLRAYSRAQAWFELATVSDRMISGFLVFDSTWDDVPHERVVNFDFDEGKEISWHDLLKQDYPMESFIETVVKPHFQRQPLFGDEAFRQWITHEPMPHFVLQKDGIRFCTRFNRLYGRQGVTIPLSGLRPYLKKNNPLERLLR